MHVPLARAGAAARALLATQERIASSVIWNARDAARAGGSCFFKRQRKVLGALRAAFV
jgi:hypothetical protein